MKRTTLLTRGDRSGDTQSSPTTSPREFISGASAEVAGREPETPRNAASAGRIGRCAPSSTLSAMPSPSRPAQRSPSLRPSPPSPPRRMSSVSARTVSADQLRARAHRVGDARAALERLEPRERVGHALERQAVGHDAAAVDRGRQRRGLDVRSGGDLGEQLLLARMRASR